MSVLSTSNHSPALADWLRDAHAVTTEMVSAVTTSVCRRFPSAGQAAKTARIERLIAAEAWTDAVLALIDLELPRWRIRRLAYDEGEWHCALSPQHGLPEWLDQPVETRHADLALALLSAFAEAQSIYAPASRTSVPVVARPDDPRYEPLCSDNFA